MLATDDGTASIATGCASARSIVYHVSPKQLLLSGNGRDSGCYAGDERSEKKVWTSGVFRYYVNVWYTFWAEKRWHGARASRAIGRSRCAAMAEVVSRQRNFDLDEMPKKIRYLINDFCFLAGPASKRHISGRFCNLA